jgi:hypothetical protein
MRHILFAVFLLLGLSALTSAQRPGVATAPAWAVRGSENYNLNNSKLLDDAEDGYINLVHEVQVNVGARATYHRAVIEIVTAAGVQNGSEVSVTYDPSYQHLVFHKICIIRDGKEINKLELSKIKTLHEETERARYIYNGMVNSVLILEDVRKGDKIEYSYSVQGFNPIFKDKFCDEEQLQYGAPVGQTLYRVICPANRALAAQTLPSGTAPFVTTEGPNKVYLWVRNNVPALDVDENIPTWYDPFPTVEVSEFQSWAEVVKWALPLFSSDHALSPGLKQEIDEINGDAKRSPEAKLLMALRFVQDEVRYMGIEMGVNSYKPNDPNRIFAQRFGDCKDKSHLLCTMLRAMGIDAVPVLINTNSKQQLRTMLPSAIDFDHCTVRANLNGKTYWFDPTVSFQRGGIDDIAYPDYKCGLVLTDTTTGLTDIPLQDHGQVLAKERFFMKDNYGPTRMEVITTYTGSFADDMRSELNNNARSDLQKQYRTFYNNYYKGIKVADSMKVEDDEQSGKVVTREFYVIDNLWDQKDGERKAHFDPLLIDRLLQKPDDHDRSMPFALTYPARYREEIEIQTPEDWDFTLDPKEVKSKFFSYSCTSSSTQRTVSHVYNYEALQDHVSPQDLSSYMEDCDKVENGMGYELTNNVNDRGTRQDSSKGWELSNTAKLWVCFALFSIIVFFVKRRK